MIKLYIFPIIGLISSCAVNADVNKPESNSMGLYYSFKICDDSNKCEISLPSSRSGKYVLNTYDPPIDEFYIKKSKNTYTIFYKNLMVENVEMGWANLKSLNLNNQNLIFEGSKIYQTYGNINSIGGGDSLSDVQSNHAKESFYYLNDYYDKYSFNQKQKIILKKQKDDSLLLDCKTYMKELDPENNYSGIFYGVCSDHKKVYFKLLK